VRCGGVCFLAEGIFLRLDDGRRRRCFPAVAAATLNSRALGQ